MVGAGLALGLSACGSGAAGELAGKSPSQILSAGVSAGEAQVGVHYVIKATGQSQTQTITGDAGRNDGHQTIVTGTSALEVELLPDGRAFVRGNAGGLQQTVGLPAAVATAYANRWISVASSDPLYAPMTQLITLRGILSQLSPSGTLDASTPGKIAGHEVIGVRGGLPGTSAKGVSGTAVLYVSTSNPTVPVGFTGQASNSSTAVNDVGAFTHWGESLHLPAPAGAVPFASLPTH